MAANDLCSLADVRALMQKGVADAAQDALISSMITPASVRIMRFCDREFAPVTTSAARLFQVPRGQELVSLAPYDLRGEPTLVRMDTDTANPVTLTADEFRTWPRPARDGTYMALRVRPFSASFGRVVFRDREVEVTGAWGFASVPADVKQACVMTVVHWMIVNPAVNRVPDDSLAPSPPMRAIPPEAYDLLLPYKRAVIA